MISLVLPIQLVSKNERDKMHWRQRHALRQSMTDIMTIKYRSPKPEAIKRRVTIIRVKGPRERDWDEQNIAAGTAIELVDALVHAGYLHDDSPSYCEPRFEQKKSDTVKGPAVIIQIEEV